MVDQKLKSLIPAAPAEPPPESVPTPGATGADKDAKKASNEAEKAAKLKQQLAQKEFDNGQKLAKAIFDRENALIDFKYQLAQGLEQQQQRIWALQYTGESRQQANIIPNEYLNANRSVNEQLRELTQKRVELGSELGMARQARPGVGTPQGGAWNA